MHPHALTDASTTQRCIQTSTARTQSVDGHDQIAGRQTGLLRRAALEHMRQTQITAFALDAHPQHRPATQRISATGRRPPTAIAQRLGGTPEQRQAMCLEQRRQRQCCRPMQQTSQQGLQHQPAGLLGQCREAVLGQTDTTAAMPSPQQPHDIVQRLAPGAVQADMQIKGERHQAALEVVAGLGIG